MEVESENEETVEEQYILVEFAGNTGSDALNQENVSIKVLGMETDEPIIKIGNQLYEGKYYDTIGTELFFTEAEGEPPSDTLFDNKLEKKLEFYGKTNTKLVVSRAFAKPLEKSRNSGDLHLPNQSVSNSDEINEV
ncbi:hypothetical protein GHT06_008233 [Daphnia sinensis]|uniref:Transcription factor TFIIIC triple barrel domain-containing protein n=1 Tax=Daphnia sinensis TaxID=1820382 RepID=A0AAD5Q1Y2_9CRUS|nr:hypothetical protein GHT06_008233 [Daphnia sinensis]